MAGDNNFTGNVDLLSANPRVGRGRVAATGLPEFESVVFGYTAAQLLAGVAAPLGSLALTTDDGPYVKTGAGDNAWTAVDAGDPLPVLLYQEQAGASTHGSNAWAATWSSPITVPSAGDWLAIFSGEVFAGAAAGTADERTLEVGFSLDGASPTAALCRKVTCTGGATDFSIVYASLAFNNLLAGQTIGSMGRKSAATGTSLNITRRNLTLQKVNLTAAP